MKIITRSIAVSAVLAGAALGTLALPAQAAEESETKISVSKDEVFPTDIFGYENPEDFIQVYYEHKKACTTDCQAGIVRGLVHNLV